MGEHCTPRQSIREGIAMDESFLGLVTMVTGWSLDIFSGPWAKEGLGTVGDASSNFRVKKHKPSVATESPGRDV